MPLKLIIRIGSTAVIEAEGDIAVDENLVKLAAEIVKALPPQEQQDAQAEIDRMADNLKAQNDALNGTVDGRTPGDDPSPTA